MKGGDEGWNKEEVKGEDERKDDWTKEEEEMRQKRR